MFSKRRITRLSEEVERLTETLANEKEHSSSVLKKVAIKEKDISGLERKICSLESEVATLRGKVRLQTENDMIVEALKVVVKGLMGKNKQSLQPSYNQMVDLQQASSKMGPYSQGLASMWGGISGRG